MNERNAILKLLALFTACACAGAVCAQTYPAKPVRVVVPYPAGAGVDIITRLYMPRLTERLGQQFIVDNRAGAAGNVGAEEVFATSSALERAALDSRADACADLCATLDEIARLAMEDLAFLTLAPRALSDNASTQQRL